MYEFDNGTVCYIAVRGEEKWRRREVSLVPCGYGLVLIANGCRQDFRGSAFFREAQDCFADAIIQAINERVLVAAEESGDFQLEPVAFRSKHIGFVRKFGETFDANAAGGMAKNGKPYNNYARWNEATALRALSGSTLTQLEHPLDEDRWNVAHNLAIQGAEIALKHTPEGPGTFNLIETEVTDVETLMAEAADISEW